MATGARLLRVFMKRTRKPLRAAAREIGISHPTLFSWMRGRTTPLSIYRERIEAWSEGIVPADSWESKREALAAKAIARADEESVKAEG